MSQSGATRSPNENAGRCGRHLANAPGLWRQAASTNFEILGAAALVAHQQRRVAPKSISPRRFAATVSGASHIFNVDEAFAHRLCRMRCGRAARLRRSKHPDFGGYPALLMRTQCGRAEDSKCVTRLPHSPGALARCRPARPGRFVLGLRRAPGLAHLSGRRGQPPRIVVAGLGAKTAHDRVDENLSSTSTKGFEFETDPCASPISMTTRRKVVDYDLASARVRCANARKFRGHDPALVTRRLLAKAPDGEPVPVSFALPQVRTR